MGYYRPEQGDGTGRGRERAPCSSAPLKRTYFHFSIKPVCKSWLSHLANLHAELPSSSLQSSTSGDLRVLFRAQWHRQDSFIARDQPSHAPDTGMTMPCTGRDKNKRTGDKVGHAQTGEENTYLFACVWCVRSRSFCKTAETSFDLKARQRKASVRQHTRSPPTRCLERCRSSNPYRQRGRSGGMLPSAFGLGGGEGGLWKGVR